MKAVLYLKFLGARINDLKEEMEKIYNVLSNPNSTIHEKISSLYTPLKKQSYHFSNIQQIHVL